jgi:antitoxin (DNA-binding transcriptional repressor) of toxin-antitoxin stability system
VIELITREDTMKFVTVRELRTRPSKVWERLRNDEVVLTSNGKPMALVTRVEEADLEPMLREVRLARMRLLTQRLRAQARRAGADRMTPRQIDALVREVRAGRAP